MSPGRRLAAPDSYDAIAELYDIDMGASADPGDRAWYLAHCGSGTRPVVELGCGTGRIALELVRAGHRVVGLDASASMLRVLAARAERELDPEQRRRLHPVRMDIRDWSAARLFDAVLCPYSAITYLLLEVERSRLFERVRDALAPDGHFLLDLFVPDSRIACLPADHVHRDYRRPLPGGGFLERSKTIAQDPTRQLNTIERRYRILDAAGRPLRSFRTRDTIRYHYPEQMQRLLEETGFDIAEISLDFGQGREDGPARCVAFACRRRE